MLTAFFVAVKYMLDLDGYRLPLKYFLFNLICVSTKYIDVINVFTFFLGSFVRFSIFFILFQCLKMF